MPLVYIVLVNYNGYKDTIECVQSLLQITYPNWKVAIVDNASKNDSVKYIREALPDTTMIEMPQNLGFAGGNNIGLTYALEHGAEYILFLNNDTLVDPEFLTRMVAVAESDSKIGAVGSKIYFADEKNRMWWVGGKLTLESGQITNLGYGEIDTGQFSKNLTNDYITGCVLMMRREVAEKIGGWDESYFHTAEDVDLSIRIAQAGYALITASDSHVWHKISQSGGGDLSAFYLYYLERNRLWLVKRYGNWHPVMSWFRLMPLLIKRFGAALIKGRSLASAMAIVYGIKDFIAGKNGKR